MTSWAAESGEPAPLLVCLDALEPQTANSSCSDGCDWRPAAAEVLRHGRSRGWALAHVLPRRSGPGDSGWTAAPGLAPLPREAVFHREGPSALGSPQFAEAAAAPGICLVLVGRSVGAACLATAVDAARLRLSLIVVADAIGLSPRERAGLEGLADMGRRTAHLHVTLTTSRRLLASAGTLRVIHGGRA